MISRNMRNAFLYAFLSFTSIAISFTASCPVKTFEEECCVFPFIYKGKSYDSCTTKDFDRPWCSLTANYDKVKDKKWGNCSTSCPVKTFEEECCVFPFIYKGKSYASCATEDFNHTWCSLTANYDKDRKWGNCNTSCPVKTLEKECCVFPFIYKGKSYASCTTKDHNHSWCSLTARVDKDKKWGYCNASCPVKTFEEECCVFPFIYKGKSYASCTTKDHSRPWCSLTASVDKDKEWGNCKTAKSQGHPFKERISLWFSSVILKFISTPVTASCPVKTLEEECCVFPFIYKGKNYTSCTTKDHNRPWCSLTANYDKHNKSGNCNTSCPVKTFEEECCVFPFVYKGKIYASCTTEDHNRPWCSLTVSYDKDKKSGNCNTSCSVKTFGKECCVFPFIYKGNSYDSCTTKDHNRPWCSLTASYDKNKEWGNCNTR